MIILNASLPINDSAVSFDTAPLVDRDFSPSFDADGPSGGALDDYIIHNDSSQNRIPKLVYELQGVSAEVVGCVRAIYDILICYGIGNCDPNDKNKAILLDGSIQRSFNRTCRHWQEMSALCGEGGWMKVAKHKLAAFVFHHLHSFGQPPKRPSELKDLSDRDDILCSGMAHRFMRYKLKTQSLKWRLSFLSSIMLLKKGCPRPTSDMLRQAELATIKFLTTERKVQYIDLDLQDLPEMKSKIDWEDMLQLEQAEVSTLINKDVIRREIRRTVFELYGSAGPLTDDDRFHPYVPSTSATYIDSVASGGAFRSLRRLAESHSIVENILEISATVNGLPSLISFKTTKESSFSDKLHGKNKHGQRVALYDAEISADLQRQWATDHKRAEVPISEFDVQVSAGEHESFSANNFNVTADVSKLMLASEELFRIAKRNALLEPPIVKPVALAESLKMRVITKGPPYTMFVLKPIQAKMWRDLKEHPAFRLIGKPVDRQYMSDRLPSPYHESEYLVSGDYSAATDNLDPFVSEEIAKAIAECYHLDEQETILLIRCLTKHLFEDPLDVQKTIEQRWGQLMGSVVSFPVLCIANAMACRLAMEMTASMSLKQKYSHLLKDLKLMINGDDCAFVTTLEGVAVWKAITSYIGLEPSIGKFFVSREFCNINSTNFIVVPMRDYRDDNSFDKIYEVKRIRKYRDGRRYLVKKRVDTGRIKYKHRTICFDQIPYVNLGLMYGMKRSSQVGTVDAVSTGTDWTIGARARELLRLCPDECKEFVYDMFIHYHYDIINSSSLRLPWYLPEALGGVGLPPMHYHDPFKDRVPSKLDLMIAHKIVQHPEKYKITPMMQDAPWNLHKIAMSRLPMLPDNRVTSADVLIQKQQLIAFSEREKRQFDRLYAYLCVDAFFTGKDPFSEKKDTSIRIIRNNEKVWRDCLHDGDLPPPLSIGRAWRKINLQIYPKVEIDTSGQHWNKPYSVPDYINETRELLEMSQADSYDGIINMSNNVFNDYNFNRAIVVRDFVESKT